MPTDLLLALFGYAVAASVTPGPNNLIVLASGLNHGVARSLPLIAGISLGFAFMLVVVGLGLGATLRSRPDFHTAAQVLGLAYMLWLAWKVASSAPRVETADGPDAVRPLTPLAGAMFQWVNPKAWAIALSATAAFSAPNAASESLAWVASIFAVVAALSLSAWAGFGSLMRRLVDTPLHIRIFNVAMALLLVASALPVAYDLLTRS